MAAAGATKVARRKRGSQQKILESADLTTLLNSSLSQASIAKKLAVYASTLPYYLKKRRREYEGGAEGEGEGDGEGDTARATATRRRGPGSRADRPRAKGVAFL